MKILFGGGKSGWVEYVLDGTTKKPRDKALIEIIDGDLALTKTIYESTHYKENYTRGVLAFQGKVDKAVMKQIYAEFKDLFLTGLSREEYNISAVLHQDTDNDHIHFCLPKLNLQYAIANNYYYDRLDRKRINLIRDYLIEKHELQEVKPSHDLVKEDVLLERIDKWRSEHKQPKLNLEGQRARNRTEKKLNDYLQELVNANLIHSQNDLKEAINALGVEVFKMGYDQQKKFHYFTVGDSEGNKIRIKGEIYGEPFYIDRAENRRSQRETPSENTRNGKRDYKRLGELEEQLQTANKEHRNILQTRSHSTKRQLPANMANLYSGSDLPSRGSNNPSDFTLDSNTRFREDNNQRRDILQDPKRKTNRSGLGPELLLSTKGVKKNEITNRADSTFQARSPKPTRRRENPITTFIKRGGQRIQYARKRVSDLTHAIQQIRESIERIIMYAKNELENFKQNISLVDFAINAGFIYNTKKSCTRSAFLEAEDKKIIVSKNEENKHYQFFNVADGKGGSIIDFYSTYIKDLSFGKIVSALRDYHKTGGYKYNLKPSSKDLQEVKREIEFLHQLKNPNEYLQSRYINQNTMDEFNGYVQEDNRGNTVFIHNRFTYEEEKLRIEKVGIERKNIDFKGHSGEKGLWGKKVGLDCEDFYIFESPMDALAFYQLHKKNGSYMATGGNTSKKQLEEIGFLELALKPKNIHLCFDKDEGGETIAKRVEEFFPMAADRLKRMKPKHKDFNEDLMEKHTPKIEGKVRVEKGDRARKRVKGFEDIGM